MNKPKNIIVTSEGHIEPTSTDDLIKKMRATAKALYRDGVTYHIADLLTEAADKLEAHHQAMIFIYSEKEVPEDVVRKLV